MLNVDMIKCALHQVLRLPNYAITYTAKNAEPAAQQD
jgi:hypothetical protein